MKNITFFKLFLIFFLLNFAIIPIIYLNSSNHIQLGNNLATFNELPKKELDLEISAISSNQPEDIITTPLGLETIDWILWDDGGSGKYRVWTNDTNNNYYIWLDWTDWINDTNLKVPINRTSFGIFNYTIEYNNSVGQFGIPDMVIVEIPTSSMAWATTEVISTESTSHSNDPAIVVDNFGNLHVVWSDMTNYTGSGTDYDIFYKCWNATLNTWTTTEVVSNVSISDSYNPAITVDSSGNIHVVWHDNTNYTGSGTDYDIFYRQKNATTSSWSTIEVISTESTEVSLYPKIISDDFGNIHVAWYDFTDYGDSGSDADIFYKFLNATNGIWNGTINKTDVISTESINNSYYPAIVVDSSKNIHIAWEDWTDYGGSGIDHDIFYKRWNDTAGSWMTTEIISTESTGDSWKPTIAVDNLLNLYVAWEDYSGADRDIFYKHWNATTKIWSTTDVVSTESSDHSYAPEITVDDSGNVHVVWEDITNYRNSQTDDDIFYKFWFAERGIWTTTEVLSTESTDISCNPAIVVNNIGNIYVVWHDMTNYNFSGNDMDIFFKSKSSSPSSNHPEDIYTTTLGSEPISWQLFDEISPGKYRIWANDTNGNFYIWRDWTNWANYKDLQIPINRSDIGVFNYTIEYNNSRGIFGIPDIVIVEISNLTSNHPEDITTSTIGLETINWTLYTDLSPGKYRVWVNDTNNNYYIWMDWTDWANNSNLQVPINRTFVGFYNYTIEYNNSLGHYGLSDEVGVTVTYWTKTEVISTESTSDSKFPVIAVDSSGNVHVAWEDSTNYSNSDIDLDIFYRCWNVSLGKWTNIEVISTESNDTSSHPTIAVDTFGNVHVAWFDLSVYGDSGNDIDIFYKYRNATTGSWSGNINVTDVISTESSLNSLYPVIAVDNFGNIFVVWYDYSNYGGSNTDVDIFCKRWNSTMGFWTITEVVSTESTGNSYFQTSALDNDGNLHVAWYDLSSDYGGPDNDILYKHWNATTGVWTTTEVVSTESTDNSEGASLSVDSYGNVHVVWFDYTNYGSSGIDHDIFYKRWNATTDTWTTTEVLSTDSADNSWHPRIKADISGNMHVVWYDLCPIYGNIFYRRWDASKDIWSLTEMISTEGTNSSSSPSITVENSGDVHVVWFDFWDYNGSESDLDIFYKYKYLMVPNTTILYSGAPPNLINNVTPITLSANDITGYGINLTRYRIDNGNWITYLAPFTLSGYEEGEHLIEYYTIDNVGNAEMIKTELLYLDITEPKILMVTSPSSVLSGTNMTIKINSDAANYEVKITIENYIIEEFMTNLGNGSYIYNWNTTGVPSGVYNINITLNDSVGNVQTYQTIVNIIIPKSIPPFWIPPSENNLIIIFIIIGIVGAAVCSASVIMVRKRKRVYTSVSEDLQRDTQILKRRYYDETTISKEEIETSYDLKTPLKIEKMKKDLLQKTLRSDYLGVSDITITLILKNLINSQISLDSIKDERILGFLKQEFSILSENEINRVLKLDIPQVSDKIAILEELASFSQEEREIFLKYLEEIEET